MKQLSREALRRMMDGSAGGSAGGGGGGGDGYAEQSWVDANYISKAFFLRLFSAYSTTDHEIAPNSSEMTLKKIEAKVDFYSLGGVTALGYGEGGGGGGGASSLVDLDDVLITSPSDGEALLYDAATGLWKNGTVGGGGGGSGTVTRVAMTVPTGFAIGGSPITNSGTLALSFDSGYSLPTTAKQNQWDGAVTGVNTLSGYFTGGVANRAARLSAVSKTAWGQTFWTSGGVPTSISGDMTNVGNVSTGGTGGLLSGFYGLELNTHGNNSGNGGTIDFHFGGASSYTSRIVEDAAGRIRVIASSGLRIGDGVLIWDSGNNALKVLKQDGTAAGIFATGFVSALGLSSGGGTVDEMTFDAITVNDEITVGGGKIEDLGSGNARISASTILYLGSGTGTYVDVYGYVHSSRLYLGSSSYFFMDSGELKFSNGGTVKTVVLQ